jgi:hypothetical protein
MGSLEEGEKAKDGISVSDHNRNGSSLQGEGLPGKNARFVADLPTMVILQK